jgi:cephalosporin-C deacetylase-like acetyl esterase
MSPDGDSWDCEVGKNKNITVQVLRNYIPINNIEISYEIYQEGMPVEKSDTLLIKKKKTKISVGTLKEPGYKRCKVTVKVDETEYKNMMTVAYSPELIKPTVNNPEDFDSFWKKSIDKVRKSNSTVEKRLVKELSTRDVEVSLIHIKDSFSRISFYGYLSKPRKEAKYPVVLFVPAAGVKPPLSRTNFINKDAITLSIEIHGLDPEMDPVEFENHKNRITGYPFWGLEDRESYYFYKGILSCIKAADFLCSLPEFDSKNFAVFGGSQGGYLSIATASLHEKVTCLVAFHPAMSDVTGYLNNRVGGWPHVFSPSQKGKYNKEEIVKTLSYYDTVNFAKKIKVPCFYSFGYNDETCPATTCSAVYNSIKSPVTLFLTPLTGHWRIPEMMTKSVNWLLKEQFK